MIDIRSEARLQAMARLIQGYVFEATIHTSGSLEFTWADDAFADLFDCEREEVNRRGWTSFVDARDLPAALGQLALVVNGDSVSVEIRIVSARGASRWLRIAAEPVRDCDNDAIRGLIGIAEDITERKQLSEQMFESINREQRRIGSDLHDELGQVLTGASLLVSGCLNRSRRGSPVSSLDLEEVLGVIKEAIETTRSLAHGLAPGALGHADFCTALKHLASRTRRWSGKNIEFSSSIVGRLPLAVGVTDHLHRIVQEAVTNSTKHSHAENISIRVALDAMNLEVEVMDDGIGFDAMQNTGFGLKNMQHRADAVGARLEVLQGTPRGTNVRVVLPSALFLRNGALPES